MASTAHMIVQQGDISRSWKFTLRRDGRLWEIPADYEFTLRMTPRDGTEHKIDDEDCTYTDGESDVYYAPVAADVDTAGIFRAQLMGTDPTANALVLDEMEITIKANVP